MTSSECTALPQSTAFAIRMALGPSGSRVVQTINRWISTNGVEWTVVRLKALRTAALQLRAGAPDLVRTIYQENSIAYYHGSLVPRGCYGRVFTLFLQAQRPSVLRRLEVVLRAYTSLRLQDLSEKQYLKAKKAINTPYQGCDSLDVVSRCVEVGIGNIISRLTDVNFKRLFGEDGSPKLRKPNIERLRSFTSTHKGNVRSKELGLTPYGKAALSIATCTCWPEAFRELYPVEVFDFIRSRVWSNGTDNDFCGHIGFIQEAGAKARVVAVPSALLQWGFEPLHVWLDALLQCIPTSDVHDQTEGAFFIERSQGSGETLFCFDLSSATDRFPRSLQTALLRDLKLEAYADALEEVCGEAFRAETPFGDEAWKYECGQPMGLYGSFPLFSLCHLSFLEGICAFWGSRSSRETIRLVGDDVIIADPAVAEKYRLLMESMGVEISESKTVQSKTVAEFAGFVGYRTNRASAVFRPYKHGCDKNIHNPIGLIYALGSALGRTGSPYWKAKVRLFQQGRRWRNPDLSPLFPISERAAGVNPATIDTTRLENLLNIACMATGSTSNSWTGEEVDLFDLRRLASILLDKQYDSDDSPIRVPMELLATPESDDVGETPYHSVDKVMSADPLMSDQTLEWLNRPIGESSVPPAAKPVADATRPIARLLQIASGDYVDDKSSNP